MSSPGFLTPTARSPRVGKPLVPFSIDASKSWRPLNSRAKQACRMIGAVTSALCAWPALAFALKTYVPENICAPLGVIVSPFVTGLFLKTCYEQGKKHCCKPTWSQVQQYRALEASKAQKNPRCEKVALTIAALCAWVIQSILLETYASNEIQSYLGAITTPLAAAICLNAIYQKVKKQREKPLEQAGSI